MIDIEFIILSMFKAGFYGTLLLIGLKIPVAIFIWKKKNSVL